MLLQIGGFGLYVREVPLIVFGVSAGAALLLGLVFDGEQVPINDKILHTGMFFLMSFSLYWIVDLSRRRAVQLTAAAMVLASVASEYAQWLLTTRLFDAKDIGANLLGSAVGVGLCYILHKRMLDERHEHRYSHLYDLDSDLEGGLYSGEAGFDDLGAVKLATATSGGDRNGHGRIVSSSSTSSTDRRSASPGNGGGTGSGTKLTGK